MVLLVLLEMLVLLVLKAKLDQRVLLVQLVRKELQAVEQQALMDQRVPLVPPALKVLLVPAPLAQLEKVQQVQLDQQVQQAADQLVLLV